MLAKSPAPKSRKQPIPIAFNMPEPKAPDDPSDFTPTACMYMYYPDFRDASVPGLCRFLDQVRTACDGICDPGPLFPVPEGDVATRTGRAFFNMLEHFGGLALRELRDRPEPADPIEREHRARVLADKRGGL